jgi:hypothetical protein
MDTELRNKARGEVSIRGSNKNKTEDMKHRFIPFLGFVTLSFHG